MNENGYGGRWLDVGAGDWIDDLAGDEATAWPPIEPGRLDEVQALERLRRAGRDAEDAWLAVCEVQRFGSVAVYRAALDILADPASPRIPGSIEALRDIAEHGAAARDEALMAPAIAALRRRLGARAVETWLIQTLGAGGALPDALCAVDHCRPAAWGAVLDHLARPARRRGGAVLRLVRHYTRRPWFDDQVLSLAEMPDMTRVEMQALATLRRRESARAVLWRQSEIADRRGPGVGLRGHALRLVAAMQGYDAATQTALDARRRRTACPAERALVAELMLTHCLNDPESRRRFRRLLLLDPGRLPSSRDDAPLPLLAALPAIAQAPRSR